MNLWRIYLVLGLGMGVLGSAAFTSSEGKGQAALTWLGDYTEAQQNAKQTGKPLFVVFR